MHKKNKQQQQLAIRSSKLRGHCTLMKKPFKKKKKKCTHEESFPGIKMELTTMLHTET